MESSPNFTGIPFGRHDDFSVDTLYRLVIQNAELADATLLARVSPKLARLVSPVLGHYDFEHALEQLHLELMVALGGGGEAGRRVDLDEPWLAVGV